MNTKITAIVVHTIEDKANTYDIEDAATFDKVKFENDIMSNDVSFIKIPLGDNDYFFVNKMIIKAINYTYEIEEKAPQIKFNRRG